MVPSAALESAWSSGGGAPAAFGASRDVVLPSDVVPCNQDGEVVQIRTATPDEVADMIAQDLFTLEACLAMGLSFVQRGWLAAEVMAPVVRRPG